jgi:predicted PurR-regulated permease PerM
MMPRDRWARILTILLSIIAAYYLAEKLLAIGQAFVDIMQLLALAGLLAFILQPVVKWLSEHPIPPVLIRPLHRRLNPHVANSLEEFSVPYGAAVVIVYLGLLIFIAVLAIFIIPIIVSQFSSLGTALPRYFQSMPGLIDRAQQELDRLNLAIDLEAIYQPSELNQRAQELGTAFVQTAFTVATGVATTISNILLVYLLSFYMLLDARKLVGQVKGLIPHKYRDEFAFAAHSIDRTFGSFIRGYILVGALYGLGAFVAMSVAGVGFSLAIASLAALIMFIPALGAPIAMFLPMLAALIQGSRATIPIFLAMVGYQQVLFRIVIPRIMSQEVGMPALLTLTAVLISVRLIGFWGFLFGVPVAGALYTIGLFLLERYRLKREDEGVDTAAHSQ